jgi:ParB family chromosome partitioning protein
MADVDTSSVDQNSNVRRPDRQVAVELIHPNPNQPRRHFSEDALNELADSIREKGIIQPLIVRPSPNQNDHFEIVAGERRWRASQIANIHEVPVIVRNFDDTEVLEVAIIENIQRADLNAIDEASGYKQLMDRFGHTQDQLANAMGKSRSHIANLLRLLTLPNSVQSHVVEGRLTSGHARALVGKEEPDALAERIIRDGLSVRQVESLMKPSSKQSKTKPHKPSKDSDTRQIEAELSAAIGMKVSIDHAADGESGKMTINYKSLDQLDDLLRALSGG